MGCWDPQMKHQSGGGGRKWGKNKVIIHLDFFLLSENKTCIKNVEICDG